MKDYINLFHSIVSEIHFWNNLTRTQKLEKFSFFLTDFNKIDHLLDYFELFNEDLSKKTLNSYLKSVSKP
jgi:cytochrome b pre-mRNA-processing protein 3